ncbi:MAG TPA: hypothetical protein VKE96_30970 [Vicinamibacterales bacterium]|nr:hypothetical protein [Vicinamibacterales bacterium]
MQDSPSADLDSITARVVDAATRDEPTSAAATLFLLRQYVATGRDEVKDALGLALAHALAASLAASSVVERAAWLAVFAEAVPIADDDRIVEAVKALAVVLSAGWPSGDGLRDGMASVDACLQASAAVASLDLVPAAIDELERVVAATYRPGIGLVDPASAAEAHSADHARAASALLTAFELTGRLPYSMLAEELMQIARRTPGRDSDFTTRCAIARAFCRLAALHDAADYRAAAVIADGADYRGDAAGLLQRQAAHLSAASTADAALYGVALREFMSLR